MRKRPGSASEAEQTVARVRGVLEGYQEREGRDMAVSISHVLDLLDPRGLWSLDPAYRKVAREQAASTGADPMTGCLPVTAQAE